MENAIELKNISTVSEPKKLQNFVSRVFKKFIFHYRSFWARQIDYEKVDRQIQETRLKYEIYRMRL